MIAEIMISEQQRINHEVQRAHLKEQKLKLRKIENKAWENDFDNQSNQPLHHHHNHHHNQHHNQHQQRHNPHHNYHQQNQEFSNLELDIIHTPGRSLTGRQSDNSSGYGFKDRERKNDHSEFNRYGKGKIENEKNSDTRMLPIPCHRKPSRFLSFDYQIKYKFNFFVNYLFVF